MGKKRDFHKFSKLMGNSFKDVRVMEGLLMPTDWDTTNSDDQLKKPPTKAGMIDLFKDNNVTKEQEKAKSGMVWASTTFGVNTPKYFKRFGTLPTEDPTLNAKRNRMKMKHVIMEKKI